jgi:hypothetical protein
MNDLQTADAVRAVRNEIRTANKLRLARWMEGVADAYDDAGASRLGLAYAEKVGLLYREVARDLGVDLSIGEKP